PRRCDRDARRVRGPRRARPFGAAEEEMSGLGPLTKRVPQVLRDGRAYHVAQLPNLTAKLDANELAYGLPAELRTRLGEELAKVDLERYPDPRAAALRAAVAQSLSVREDQLVFGNGSDELIALLA